MPAVVESILESNEYNESLELDVASLDSTSLCRLTRLTPHYCTALLSSVGSCAKSLKVSESASGIDDVAASPAQQERGESHCTKAGLDLLVSSPCTKAGLDLLVSA